MLLFISIHFTNNKCHTFKSTDYDLSFLWEFYDIYLKDDENGKEDEHKEQETAGVQREQVVFVGKVGLRETRKSF